MPSVSVPELSARIGKRILTADGEPLPGGGAIATFEP
jgi:hypothetical protein